MTRRHFEAIAAAFRQSRPRESIAADGNDREFFDRLYQWRIDRDFLADVCAAQNGRFDRERFVLATER